MSEPSFAHLVPVGDDDDDEWKNSFHEFFRKAVSTAIVFFSFAKFTMQDNYAHLRWDEDRESMDVQTWTRNLIEREGPIGLLSELDGDDKKISARLRLRKMRTTQWNSYKIDLVRQKPDLKTFFDVFQ